MKLVIDIPDEEYEDVKKTGGCYYDFGKAIYYGVPHETVTEFADRCRECGREKVLDEIRAEIEQEPYVSKMEVLDIIDKYMVEGEE
jgi:hypothetical protein